MHVVRTCVSKDQLNYVSKKRANLNLFGMKFPSLQICLNNS